MLRKIFKVLLRTLKIIGLTIVSILFIVLLIATIFINTSPEFGGTHSDKDIERYAASGHYEDGIFINLTPTYMMEMNWDNTVDLLKEFLKDNPNSSPDFELPVHFVDSNELVNAQQNQLLWFGHSAFLLQLDGKNILLDPMLGESPAPHPTIGAKRYYSKLPIEIEQLPDIDVVILSHDHYDHLDYNSIMKLKDKTKAFFVPLGVGAHLRAWDIDEEKIHELNWWDETSYQELELAFTPSRHFSGRGVMDNSTTLWGSWVIKGNSKNIFFSGDGGYGSHFKEIGEKYGPFDFAMMECGQYNERWSEIHMMPEETAQAAVDVNADLMMPIHWGAFTLALHTWDDPVKRVTQKASEISMPITVPIIGEFINLDIPAISNKKWWIN